MTAKGHMVLSVVPYTAYYNTEIVQSPLLIGGLALAAMGSLVPDIDEPGSYIGRRLKPVSVILKAIGIKHRTITHYALLPLMILLFSVLVLPRGAEQFLGVVFAYGVFMHGVGDMLTKGGIKNYFWPLFAGRTARILPRSMAFYTNSSTEHILVLLMAGASTFFVFTGGL